MDVLSASLGQFKPRDLPSLSCLTAHVTADYAAICKPEATLEMGGLHLPSPHLYLWKKWGREGPDGQNLPLWDCLLVETTGLEVHLPRLLLNTAKKES